MATGKPSDQSLSFEVTKSEEGNMKKLMALIALAALSGCAKEMPQKPQYQTTYGDECAAECEKDYSECLASNIRPDFLVFSPRKKACESYIRDCYQLCEKKEN